jgi:anaerobic selenocysteine-containing dehydrogenase
VASTDGEEPREVRSFCRICNALCGIVVTVEGDRVVGVRGDADHPMSRGYTCPKGRALPAFHHHPDRLDEPVLRTPAGEEAPGADAVLDDHAARISAAVEAGGPDAVAMYLASGSAFDTNGRRFAERFLRLLGSPQKYTATTIDTPCKPLVAELLGGWSGLTPIWDHDRSRLLLLFGTNPVVSHGHSNAVPDPVRRLRALQARGGQVWVVDPRRTETAALADHHLALRPGTDHVLLAHLVRELLPATDAERVAVDPDDLVALADAVAPFDLAHTAAHTGLAPADITGLVAAVRAAGAVSALTGTGTSMTRTANVTEWLLWCLHIVTGSSERPGGMWFNPGYLLQLDRRSWTAVDGEPEPGPASRPALPRRFGEYPCAALVPEIEAGTVRVLLVVGGNPVCAFPERDRTVAALETLDTLAVLDVVETDTTALATHVLPAAGQLERADVPWLLDAFQLEVASQRTASVVAPAAGRRPVWWWMAELGRRLGFTVLPDGLDPATCTDDDLLDPLLARSRGGIDALPPGVAVTLPDDPGRDARWVHERVLPDGRWRLVPPVLLADLAALAAEPVPQSDELLLVPHRGLRRMNSQLRDLPQGRPEPERPRVTLAPSDAERLGLEAGGLAVVASAHGRVTATVAVDERLRSGAALLPHGFAEPNVGALTHTDVDIDPRTGMVRLGAFPVRVTPADADEVRSADR